MENENVDDGRVDVIRIFRNKNIKVNNNGSGAGFVWVELEDIVIFGTYISPKIDLNSFEDFLASRNQTTNTLPNPY